MIQINATNRLMTEKKTVGIYLPTELVEVYQALTKRLKGNEKWLVASAAFLALLRMPEHERLDLFGKIKAADLPGRSMKALIDESGDLGKIAAIPPASDNIHVLPKIPKLRGKNSGQAREAG